MAVLSLDDAASYLWSAAEQGLIDAGRPVCSSRATIGPPVIGLVECCECDQDTSGQLSTNLERAFPADGTTLEEISGLVGTCPTLTTAADFSLVLARCYPRINDDGEMPSADETTSATGLMYADITAVVKALMCSGQKIRLREVVIQSDPDGGCSAFTVRVTVPVKLL